MRRNQALYQNVTVEVFPTGKLYPRWIGVVKVDDSDMCGNEYWPMVWSFSKRAAMRRILRKARRHKAKWRREYERDQLEERDRIAVQV